MHNKTLPTFWKRKIVDPLQGFLTQGLSSQKLALRIAFGIILGTFPVLGVTTILCTLALLYAGLKPALVRLNSESSRFKFFRRR